MKSHTKKLLIFLAVLFGFSLVSFACGKQEEPSETPPSASVAESQSQDSSQASVDESSSSATPETDQSKAAEPQPETPNAPDGN